MIKIGNILKKIDKKQFKNVCLILVAAALMLGSVLYLVLVLFASDSGDGKNGQASSVRGVKESNIKNGTFYRIDVRSFVDSNNDGIGDFKGIYSKIDYLKKLGITGVVLSPIQADYTEKGLSVTDYYQACSKYEVDGYKIDELIKDLDAAGINTYLDLIIRNTSSECAWFKEGFEAYKNGSDSPYKYFYNFSLNNFEYSSKKFVVHQRDSIYYESTDGAELPNLNFDNPDVIKEVTKIVEYWAKKGVMGFDFVDIDLLSTQTDTRKDIVTEICSSIQENNSNLYLMCDVNQPMEKVTDLYLAGMDTVLTTTDKPKVENMVEGLTGYSNWIQYYQGTVKGVNQDAVTAYRATDDDNLRAAYYTNKALLKSVAALTILNPGNAFITYGEELGLRDEKIADKFNTESDIFKYYQKAIELKKRYKQLYSGTAKALMNNSAYISSVLVTCENKEYIIIQNMSEGEALITIDDSNMKLESGAWISADGKEPKLNDNKLTMPGCSSVIISVANISKVDINCLYVDYVKEMFYLAFDDENWAISKDNQMKEIADGVYGISKKLNKGAKMSISTAVNRFGYYNLTEGGYSDSIGINSDDYFSFTVDSDATYSFVISELNDKFMVFASDDINEDKIKLVNEKTTGNSSIYFTSDFLDWKAVDDSKFKYDDKQKLYYYDIRTSGTNKMKITKNKLWYGYGNVVRKNRNMFTCDTELGNILLEAGTYRIYFNEKDETIAFEKK